MTPYGPAAVRAQHAVALQRGERGGRVAARRRIGERAAGCDDVGAHARGRRVGAAVVDEGQIGVPAAEQGDRGVGVARLDGTGELGDRAAEAPHVVAG